MEETKRERFVRLAESRMNNALKQIELLSNLSNKRVYEYNDEDVALMVRTLKKAINSLEYSFSEKKEGKFKIGG